MEIKVVIVDRLPKGCDQCPHSEKWSDCYFTGRSTIQIETGKFIKKFPFRPDWCPLMTLKHQLKLWEYAQTGDWDAEKESKE
jgi:hypothetical protein